MENKCLLSIRFFFCCCFLSESPALNALCPHSMKFLRDERDSSAFKAGFLLFQKLLRNESDSSVLKGMQFLKRREFFNEKNSFR
jgi:hypothetical protein